MLKKFAVVVVVVWYRVIIVSALSLSLRDKERLRDWESLTKDHMSEAQNSWNSKEFFGNCIWKYIFPFRYLWKHKKIESDSWTIWEWWQKATPLTLIISNNGLVWLVSSNKSSLTLATNQSLFLTKSIHQPSLHFFIEHGVRGHTWAEF